MPVLPARAPLLVARLAVRREARRPTRPAAPRPVLPAVARRPPRPHRRTPPPRTRARRPRPREALAIPVFSPRSSSVVAHLSRRIARPHVPPAGQPPDFGGFPSLERRIIVAASRGKQTQS